MTLTTWPFFPAEPLAGLRSFPSTTTQAVIINPLERADWGSYLSDSQRGQGASDGALGVWVCYVPLGVLASFPLF